MEKKKCFSEELLCVVLLVGVGFGVASGVAIYASAYPIFQSDNWAAWVQAVGALLALCVAIALSASERTHRRQERVQERDRHVESVAYDVSAAALELQLRIAQLHNAPAGYLSAGPYLAEQIILNDLLVRLGSAAQGDVPTTQKNLVFEIRKLLAEVLAYVMAQTDSNTIVTKPDWDKWIKASARLFQDADESTRK